MMKSDLYSDFSDSRGIVPQFSLPYFIMQMYLYF